MRIVHVIAGLSTGGAETMLLNVVEQLDSRFQQHVISLTSLGEIGPRIRKLGIPVEALGMRPGIPSPLGFIRLVRRLKVLKPELVHTWMYHADLLGGLASRLAGVPAVAWAIRHGNLDHDKMKLSTRAVVGVCARISSWVPDRILSCSEVARRVHVECGYAAGKMVVIPNGFDLARFRPDAMARMAKRAELRVRDDTPLVGLIGRYDPQKNLSGFFKAAGMLHVRMPAVRFVLIGKGIDAGNRALKREIEAAGVDQVTHLLGMRSDIPGLIAALDVLASSSYGEAFPNAVGEAMACGVPCAVTDVGDSAQIVADTGRVVASGDMAGLAAAMESLLMLPADERRALGVSARARVAERFEIGAVVRRYEAFYEDLAAVGRNKRLVR